MAKVVIAFSPEDPKQVGKTVEVDDAEAKIMVRQGRARYADSESSRARSRKSPNTETAK